MLSLRGLALEVYDVILRKPLLCWSRLGRGVLCGCVMLTVLCCSRKNRMLQGNGITMRPLFCGHLRKRCRDLLCGGHARGCCVRWLQHRFCWQSSVLPRGVRGDVSCGDRATGVLCSSRGRCLRQLGMRSLRALLLETRDVGLRHPVLCRSRLDPGVFNGSKVRPLLRKTR